jgi:pimeloyl-ACP methyl ester carboxylesterase
MGGIGLIFLIAIASLIIVLIAAGLLYQAIHTARDRHRFPSPGPMIDIDAIDVGNRRLHAEIKGAGSPPVVFEAGIAATSLSWSAVQNEIAKSQQTISYDRAGLGWSDPARSCDLDATLTDLRTLLDRAKIPSPRVIAGHSFGGLIALAYAARYPQEVAGLVLVDPAGASEWADPTPAQRALRRRGIFLSRVGELLAYLGVVRFALNLAAAGSGTVPRLIARASSGKGGAAFTERMLGEVRKLPQTAWKGVQLHWSSPKCFRTSALSLKSLPSIARAVLQEAKNIEAPMIILSAGNSSEAQRADHELLARTARHARLEIVKDSGHWILLDRPDVVVRAIAELSNPEMSESGNEDSRVR